LTTAPPPRSYMWGSTARRHRNVPVRVTSSTIDHCSSVISTIGALPPRPALFIHTSMPPRASIEPWTRCCTCSSSVTLHRIVVGRGPSSASRSAVSPRRRSCRSEITKRAPSSWHRSASADPMPVPAAAVMTTPFPSSRCRPGGGCGAVGTAFWSVISLPVVRRREVLGVVWWGEDGGGPTTWPGGGVPGGGRAPARRSHCAGSGWTRRRSCRIE
jgi:hypothetical protein